MEVDVSGPRPVLLEGAANLTERHRFLVAVAKAEHHDRPPTNTPIATMTQVRISMLDSNLIQQSDGCIR